MKKTSKKTPAPEETSAPAKVSVKTKPMFEPHERLYLGGYSPAEKNRIREITIALVTSRVEKGEVNPDNPVELKAAIIEAGHTARSAYNAALEYLSG